MIIFQQNNVKKNSTQMATTATTIILSINKAILFHRLNPRCQDNSTKQTKDKLSTETTSGSREQAELNEQKLIYSSRHIMW